MTVIGLTRYRSTEQPGTSLCTLFGTLEECIRRNFDVIYLSPFYRFLDVEHRKRVGAPFLEQCDLVVTTGTPELFAIREAMHFDVSMVFVALGDLPRGAFKFRKILPYLDRRDLLLFSSSADKAIYHHLVSQCPSQEALVPFGTDTDEFAPISNDTRDCIRSQMGVAEDDVVFLYVGRVTSEKNLHTAMGLFADLANKYATARFLIVGPISDVRFDEFGTGPYDLEAIYRRIITLNPVLSERVQFWCHVDRAHLPVLYSCSDVFLNLTVHHDENFGYAQVEAMACGLPVVGTDWGGLRDSIVHGQTGYRVKTYLTLRGVHVDIAQAFHYCARLLESRDLRKELSRKARKHAKTNYSLDVFERNLRQALLLCRNVLPSDSYTVFSAFGQRYSWAFSSTPSVHSSNQTGVEPDGVLKPHYTKENYELYAGLIGPYCSGLPSFGWTQNHVLTLAPVLMALSPREIVIDDPLWPIRRGLSPIEHTVLTVLNEQGTVVYEQMRSAVSKILNGSQLDQCLDTLIQDGIIIKSDRSDY